MTLAEEFASRRALPEAIAANVRRFGHVISRSRGLDPVMPPGEDGRDTQE